MSTSAEDRIDIRRIVIALDDSRHSRAAMGAATQLAAILGAAVEGVFVEDTRLLRISELDGVAELTYPFISTAALTPERVARQFRAQAVQIRRAMSAVCDRYRIAWSFRVVRGDVTSTILEAASDADMLCLGKLSRPLLRRMRIGSTARAAISHALSPVLILHHDIQVAPPVIVAYDGSAEAKRSLVIATRLAREIGGFLGVLLVASTEETQRKLKREIAHSMIQTELFIRTRSINTINAEALIQLTQAEACGLLIMHARTLPVEDMCTLLEHLDCPALLTR